MVKKKDAKSFKESREAKGSIEKPREEEQEKKVLTDVEQAITELREKAKEDPSIDFNKELRKIQDQISDAKGEARRPITAKSNHADDDDDEDEQEEEEEEEEEEDPDAEIKELTNKRLTTCMLLALSFESDESYPRDFYEKLAESGKFKEVVSPFTAEERKSINQHLKERKKEAEKRVKACEQV